MNALTLQHLGMESSTCSGMGGISVGVDWPGEHEGAGTLDKGKGRADAEVSPEMSNEDADSEKDSSEDGEEDD